MIHEEQLKQKYVLRNPDELMEDDRNTVCNFETGEVKRVVKCPNIKAKKRTLYFTIQYQDIINNEASELKSFIWKKDNVSYDDMFKIDKLLCEKQEMLNLI